MTPRISARAWARRSTGSGVWVCSEAELQRDCLSTRSEARMSTTGQKDGKRVAASAPRAATEGTSSSERDAPRFASARPETPSSDTRLMALVTP